jgi:large subunit ribosomal protein L18
MRTEKKQKLKQLRQWRIRKVVSGTAERPRMSVCFTNENIHIQFIDDIAGKTIVATSTVSKGETKDLSANVNGARKIGEIAAKAAMAKGISAVVFDRRGNRYQGKVKALADAAREAGLKF